MDPPQEEEANMRLLRRWQEMQANEVRYKEYYLDDAEYVVVGFGSAGRVALSAVRAARAEGHPGRTAAADHAQPLPRHKQWKNWPRQVKGILVVEMNTGQMLEDVRLAVAERVPGRILRPPGRRDALPG